MVIEHNACPPSSLQYQVGVLNSRKNENSNFHKTNLLHVHMAMI